MMLTPKQLGNIEKAIVKRDSEFCPNLNTLIKMANETIIPKNSFARFINRKQLSNAEKYAKRSVGDKCRTRLNFKDAEKVWNETVKHFQELQEKGKLQNYENTCLLTHTPNEPSKAEIYGKNRNLSSNLTQSMKKRLARITELRNNNVQQA